MKYIIIALLLIFGYMVKNKMSELEDEFDNEHEENYDEDDYDEEDEEKDNPSMPWSKEPQIEVYGDTMSDGGFEECPFPTDGKDLAQLIPKVRNLNLSKTEINDDGCRALGELGKLKSLSLSSPKISDTGFAIITQSVRVKRFYIYDYLINSDRAKSLANLTSLESLVIYLSGANSEHLCHLPDNIVDLALAYDEILDITHMHHLTQLETLNVSNIKIADWSALSAFQQLKNLTLGGESQNDINLTGLNNIETLTLAELPITSLDCLRSMSKLQTLHLSGVPIVSLDGTELLTQLEDLTLDNVKIADEGMSAITNFPNLKNFTLENSNIGNEAVKHLAKLGKLEHVSLESNIDDEAIKYLAELPCLNNLEIYSDSVTPEGMLQLCSRPNNHRLEVWGWYHDEANEDFDRKLGEHNIIVYADC